MSARGMTAGYSLLELLVVVAIIGLLAAIAAPAVMASVDRMTLSADARAVVTQLRELRDRALDQQTPVVIGERGEAFEVASGTKIETEPRTGLVVGPDGTMTGVLVLRRGEASVTIVMDRFTGRVRSESVR